eukprot:SAG31_NODE_1401_length_8497_cov_4.386640_4_plen_283_part_00
MSSEALSGLLTSETDTANILHASAALAMLAERGQPAALNAVLGTDRQVDENDLGLQAMLRHMRAAASTTETGITGLSSHEHGDWEPVAGLMELGARFLRALACWIHPTGCVALLTATMHELGLAMAAKDGNSSLLGATTVMLLLEKAHDVETVGMAALSDREFVDALSGALQHPNYEIAAVVANLLLLLAERGGSKVNQKLLELDCKRNLCAAVPPRFSSVDQRAADVVTKQLEKAATYFSTQSAAYDNAKHVVGRRRVDEVDERTAKLIKQRKAVRAARRA